MKKLLFLLLVVSFLLTACGGTPETTEPTAAESVAASETPTTITTTAPVEESTVPTTAPVEETAPPTTAPMEPSVTEPAHSALYIPGVDVEDVILWFNEVCLAAEFVNSGDPSFLQKWDTTIYYCVHGNPTEENLSVLNSFARWLNSLEGFPGIYETTDPLEANLAIHFCTQEEMHSRIGDWTSGLDGAVTFWYNDDRIYDATICVRNDLNQYLRNSVILEELYNGLGPVQDTSLRYDSLIYAGYSEPQELTQIDELILRLLYHPDMKCGMDSAQCEEVIRKLYY